jgi:hypothetical protein
MPNAFYYRVPILAMVASVVILIIGGSILRIGSLFIIVATASILLAAIYVWNSLHSPQTPQKTFWIALEASLIFFGGAVYGVVQSLREGWQWTDLLFFVFPIAMGAYLLWFAFKIRRKATTY